MAKRPHGKQCGCHFCTSWDADLSKKKQMKQCDKCGEKLPEDSPHSVYVCTDGSGCALVRQICKVCEFEHGWGYPLCRICGKIFDPVPILERIKQYVSSVNADYSEDEERDQTVAMIDALIKHAKTP